MTPPQPAPDLIYKIATRDIADAARTTGTFPRMPIDHADGFVHFSTAAQLPETLRLHFSGQGELVLLAVRTADIGSALRWEPSWGGDLFPHVYGTLPMASVVHVAEIAVDDAGACTLPEWVA